MLHIQCFQTTRADLSVFIVSTFKVFQELRAASGVPKLPLTCGSGRVLRRQTAKKGKTNYRRNHSAEASSDAETASYHALGKKGSKTSKMNVKESEVDVSTI